MMQPADAASGWALPQLETTTELAAWLEISSSELEWFADFQHYLRRPRVSGKLRHYRYRFQKKTSGTIRLPGFELNEITLGNIGQRGQRAT